MQPLQSCSTLHPSLCINYHFCPCTLEGMGLNTHGVGMCIGVESESAWRAQMQRDSTTQRWCTPMVCSLQCASSPWSFLFQIYFGTNSPHNCRICHCITDSNVSSILNTCAPDVFSRSVIHSFLPGCATATTPGLLTRRGWWNGRWVRALRLCQDQKLAFQASSHLWHLWCLDWLD